MKLYLFNSILRYSIVPHAEDMAGDLRPASDDYSHFNSTSIRPEFDYALDYSLNSDPIQNTQRR